MRDALAATKRPIVFSICEWGVQGIFFDRFLSRSRQTDSDRPCQVASECRGSFVSVTQYFAFLLQSQTDGT